MAWPSRDRIIFDVYESRTNQTTRYAYSLDGTVDRFFNLSSMVGYPITEITGLDIEDNGQYKILIRTSGLREFGVIYLSNIIAEEGRITEEGEQRVLEQGEEDTECLCRITEESNSGDVVTIADVSVGKNPPYKLGPDGNYWIVEEGDVDYGVGFGQTALDCDDECTPYNPPIES